MTDEERDRRVFEIFAQACGLPDQDRAALLDELCAGDPELRRQAEAMLVADASPSPAIDSGTQVDGFLSRQIALLHPEWDGGSRGEPPALDGHYTILRSIGEGGMGAVYEAEQHSPRRRVAIKAIRPGRITPQLRKRFDYEAQVLARLEHPGIARLYESNTQSDGGRVRAYLAMELVKGEPIDAYVANHALEIPQRLALFAKVCDAIAYAHRMGVIHRDLKPANILITSEGDPKILDFGVARIVSDERLVATQLTQDGQMIGTLAYMSPEQVEGRHDLDTRTDVYALGVLLYKLLSGRLPIDIDDTNLLTASRRVLEETPRKVGQLDRRFKGDLETIVSKAMEKDPARRYSSVEQLRSELERYLSGRPIEARGDSAFYRVRKSIWRHRGLVAIVLAVIGSITAFGIYASIQADRNHRLAVVAADARDDAMRSEARATARATDLRNLLYFSSIGFAQSAMESNDMARAHRLLDGCDEELRGWEWFYLHRLCDMSSATTDLRLQRPRYASYDRDRGKMALATLDREVLLLDRVANTEMVRVTVPDGTARAAISPDGRWLAYGGVLEATHLVDLQTGERRKLAIDVSPDLISTYHATRTLAFTNDSRRLVVGGLDGRLRVWDVGSAALRTTISLGDPLPLCMLISPTDDWVAIGDSRSGVRVFDLESGALMHWLAGHDAPVWSLALSPDGKQLASGDNDARVIVWNIATGARFTQIDTNDGWITALCFSPDGETLAMGRDDSTIGLLNLANASTAGVLRGHLHAVIHIDWELDESLRTVSIDGTMKSWDLQSALHVPTITTGQPQSIGLAFARQGKQILVGGSDGTVRSWDLPDRNDATPIEGRRLPDQKDGVLEIAVDRTGTVVCTAGRDGVVRISSLQDESPPRTIRPEAGSISAIDITPDGQKLIVGALKEVALWDIASGRRLRVYTSAEQVVNEIRFDATAEYFYAGCADGRVRRWSVESSEPMAEAMIDTGGVYDLNLSPDGLSLAVAGDTGTVAVVDALTLGSIRRFLGHQGPVFGITFHPSGQRLVSAGADRSIRVWDRASGSELIALREHRRAIQHVQFSPDGETLASSSDDGTVKLWRTAER